jgi:ATP-dependent DNA helicase PIF1
LIEIIAQMQRKYGSGIAITASTGIAACNIGGLTLHSFAGIGLGHDSVEKLVKKITSIKQVYRRWTSISVLVIDESKCCVVFSQSAMA